MYFLLKKAILAKIKLNTGWGDGVTIGKNVGNVVNHSSHDCWCFYNQKVKTVEMLLTSLLMTVGVFYKGWLASAKLKPIFTFLGRDFAK